MKDTCRASLDWSAEFDCPWIPGSGLHTAATALNYFAYNFIKIHRTLRVSPAMAAGVADRLWGVEDLVALWESYEQRSEEKAE